MATWDNTSAVGPGEILAGTAGDVAAREYLRVSYDRSGRERSNTEQQDDNRQAWQQLSFGEHYSDTESASRYATKQRGDWLVLTATCEQTGSGHGCWSCGSRAGGRGKSVSGWS